MVLLTEKPYSSTNDLTISEWLEHSIEEKMDDIIYMQKIKKLISEKEYKNIKIKDL